MWGLIEVNIRINKDRGYELWNLSKNLTKEEKGLFEITKKKGVEGKGNDYR